jgi:DNA polymerase-3 subunit alpha/error-prone DNA polymerase
MISNADTVGVFQIESRAQMQTLPRMKPTHFYDLVVEVALIRPGPLQGGMVHPYLRRRQGLEKVDYGHPKLEAVLKKTLGVPIFQEQVMKIVMSAASFTPGEADELRRLMAAAWRGKGTMEGVRHRVMNGFKENGISKEYAKKIFQTIEGFANYGFPESHAASFALLSYASSYLKCHHPEVFLCALLNSQPMGFYSVRTLISDAERHGVSVLPIDIQTSAAEYTLEKSKDNKLCVRTGLNSVYGLPQKHLNHFIQVRKQKTSFKNLSELIQETQLPKSTLIKLAAAGAMRSFGDSPRNLIWKIEATELDQSSFLWGFPRENLAEESSLPPVENQWQSLQREYSAKGFVIENHPMRLIRNASFRLLSSKDLLRLPDKKKLSIAGLLAFTQKPPTAKGFCFMTLEDEFGLINVVVPPKVYEQHRLLIYNQCLLKITGTLQKKSSVINIKAEALDALF